MTEEGADRELLDYRPEDLHLACERVAEILARTDNVFERGGALVRVGGGDPGPTLTRQASDEEAAEALRQQPRIIPLTGATLRALLAARLVVRRWVPKKGGEPEAVPVRAPDDLIKATLDAGAWCGLRALNGISETAFLRPDGTVVTEAGFDRATGYYLAPTSPFLPVPERPTQEDARAALLELEEPFLDFPHVTREHRMVGLSAILTLLARPAIHGNVPAHVFDASTRGTGKSLQSDVVAIIATGRESPKMGWPSNPEELAKVLAAYAMRGTALINFDNVTGTLGGADLDRCITAGGKVELRVLGSLEQPSFQWRALIVASGNNVELAGDTTRRALVGRMESPLENPEERSGFRYPNLLAWVHENRARLVRAALTILRAYVVAGRPDMRLRTFGSFEAWAALVPTALVWAGGADAMVCRPEVTGAPEASKSALLVVIEHWPRLSNGQPMTLSRAVATLYPPRPPRDAGPLAPDGFQELRDALGGATNTKPGMVPSPRSLGKLFAKQRGRVAGGKRLVGKPDRKGVMEWVVESAGCAGSAGSDSPHAARENTHSSPPGNGAKETRQTRHTRQEGSEERDWTAEADAFLGGGP